MTSKNWTALIANWTSLLSFVAYLGILFDDFDLNKAELLSLFIFPSIFGMACSNGKTAADSISCGLKETLWTGIGSDLISSYLISLNLSLEISDTNLRG